jgi:hypothetical protein
MVWEISCDDVSQKASELCHIRYPHPVQELIRDSAQIQKLRTPGDPSSSQCFSRSFGVGIDVASSKGN